MDAPDSDPHGFKRRGVLFVLSSPSGAGKSTIARMLREDQPELVVSVSYTTRPIRPGEVDGVDYHFVDLERFRAMVANHEFLEWAHVFGHRYGTPKAQVWNVLEQGRDILFDIDWQGARQLEPDFKGQLVSIFLLPPSMAELEQRLRARGTDSPEVIADRMRRAADEISHWAEYEYVLLNDEMDECLARVRSIIEAERSKRVRQTSLNAFVRGLIGPEH